MRMAPRRALEPPSARRLHSQLAQMSKRLHAFEAAAARGSSSSSSMRAVSSALKLGAALGAVEASGAGGAALSVDKGVPRPLHQTDGALMTTDGSSP